MTANGVRRRPDLAATADRTRPGSYPSVDAVHSATALDAMSRSAARGTWENVG
ncbi:hypothetical protein ABZ646_46750 [Streptomyces sp. NPDC007162]|uniref:hypothetical protein n=1 Tax=Streptomyces sp. NPDC007162 TaxID=3156917 RepID=UPI0033EA60B5